MIKRFGQFQIVDRNITLPDARFTSYSYHSIVVYDYFMLDEKLYTASYDPEGIASTSNLQPLNALAEKMKVNEVEDLDGNTTPAINERLNLIRLDLYEELKAKSSTTCVPDDPTVSHEDALGEPSEASEKGDLMGTFVVG